MQCSSCPYTMSDEAEQAINWGCVPTIGEIHEIAREHNVTWGCHGMERACVGFVEACKETGIDSNTPVISYNTWANDGIEKAVEEAIAAV